MIEAIVVSVLLVAGLLYVARQGRDETISMPAAPASQGSSASVESMIRAGRKIDAIKLLREETGLGLKEAKDEVERRAREIQPT